MNSEKVQLAPNAASYSIEVDLQDLNLSESISSRYERYSQEQISQKVLESTGKLPTSSSPAQDSESSTRRERLRST